MSSFGSAKLPPMGTLKAAFGRDGTRSASVEAILYQYGIERDFPAPVRAAAELAPSAVEPAALEGRLDLRGGTVITIDGASSKDFDDAVSLERDGDGNWVLGVHIADVSHYVTEGSPLDLEAFHRGTSVYFADQVVPMLPEALSNGICSLNPQVDRLALSCIMTMDGHGAMLGHKLAKTVIRSTERMTYEDCNLLLEDQSSELAARYAHILPMLRGHGPGWPGSGEEAPGPRGPGSGEPGVLYRLRRRRSARGYPGAGIRHVRTAHRVLYACRQRVRGRASPKGRRCPPFTGSTKSPRRTRRPT